MNGSVNSNEDFARYLGVDYKKQYGNILICCPFHDDTHPSLVIYPEIDRGTCCFQAGTKVITRDGVKKIEALVGKDVEVINGNGDWEHTTFKSYGYATIYKLTLTRNKIDKVIYTTASHKWQLRGCSGWVSTGHLAANPKYVGRSLTKKVLNHTFMPNAVNGRAFSHGCIFGDGYEMKSKRHKDGSRVFALPVYKDEKKPCAEFADYVGKVKSYWYGVKEDWKTVFDLSKYSDEYLYWFLAGYFATDGNCSGQTLSISSAKKENLELVRDICVRLGFWHYCIVEQDRIGFGKVPTKLYQIRFGGVDNKFFRRKEQIPKKRKFSNYLGWTIKSVEKTSDVEEVYCCETSTQSFVLEDFILTHNCFVCGKTWSWAWLAHEIKGIPYPQACEDLGQELTGTGKPMARVEETTFCDEREKFYVDAYNAKFDKCSTDYPDKMVAWLERKQLTEVARELDWRWHDGKIFRGWKEGIVIPHRKLWTGDDIDYVRIREWNGEGFDKPKGSFKMTVEPYFSTFRPNSVQFLVEGESDAASIYAHGGSAVGIPGATSKKAINTVLAAFKDMGFVKSVIVCGDNDDAGVGMNKLVVEAGRKLAPRLHISAFKHRLSESGSDINDEHVKGFLRLPVQFTANYWGNYVRQPWADKWFIGAISELEQELDNGGKWEDVK